MQDQPRASTSSLIDSLYDDEKGASGDVISEKDLVSGSSEVTMGKRSGRKKRRASANRTESNNKQPFSSQYSDSTPHSISLAEDKLEKTKSVWSAEQKQSALELVEKLFSKGETPEKLVRDGVHEDVVRWCCGELNLPFLMGDTEEMKAGEDCPPSANDSKSQPERETQAAGDELQRAEEDLVTETSKVASTAQSADAAKASMDDSIAAMREAALASRKRLKEQLASAATSNTSSSLKLEAAPEVTNATFSYKESNRSLLTAPIGRFDSQRRGYRDVDAPPQDISLDYSMDGQDVLLAEEETNDSIQRRGQRAQISYADDDLTPAGEVDTTVPLPTLQQPTLAPRSHPEKRPKGTNSSSSLRSQNYQKDYSSYDDYPSPPFWHRPVHRTKSVPFLKSNYQNVVLDISSDEEDGSSDDSTGGVSSEHHPRTSKAKKARREYAQEILELRNRQQNKGALVQSVQTGKSVGLDTPPQEIIGGEVTSSLTNALSSDSPHTLAAINDLLEKEEQIKKMRERIRARESQRGKPNVKLSPLENKVEKATEEEDDTPIEMHLMEQQDGRKRKVGEAVQDDAEEGTEVFDTAVEVAAVDDVDQEDIRAETSTMPAYESPFSRFPGLRDYVNGEGELSHQQKKKKKKRGNTKA